MELLIFDLDGTLIDSKRDIAKSVNLTFRDLGLPEKPEEMIYGYVGNGVRQLIVDAVECSDDRLVDAALRRFEYHYLRHLLDETVLFPGIDAVLKHYEDKKKALVTNKPVRYTEGIVTGLKIGGAFDLVIAGDAALPLKPHPAMLLKTLDRLKVKPERAVMIGDSLNDIAAARSAGVRVCAVGYGFGGAEELKGAAPDYFAASGEALIGLF